MTNCVMPSFECKVFFKLPQKFARATEQLAPVQLLKTCWDWGSQWFLLLATPLTSVVLDFMKFKTLISGPCHVAAACC